MNYEKMTSQDFKDEIARRRERIYARTYRMGSIQASKVLLEEYENLCADAAGGDPIAEDILAEWFRNGNNIVPENMETAMPGLFAAGDVRSKSFRQIVTAVSDGAIAANSSKHYIENLE